MFMSRLHPRAPRVAEDAARAERARAELHAAVEPADDLRLARAARPRAPERADGSSFSYTIARLLEEASRSRRPRTPGRDTRPSSRRAAAVAAARTCRGCLKWRCQISCATPSAPPASPAAGWIQSCLNGPSRSSRPLPTQLSATPPARHKVLEPGLAVRRPRHAQHDLFAHHLHRPREIHLLLRQVGLGHARRAAEQLVERAVRHRQPGQVVEVLLVRA